MRIPLLAALIGLTAAAPPTAKPAPSPGEIVAAAPADAWRAIPPENLLVMTLGSGKRVVIELAPAFAPVHVANIRALAHAGWFDQSFVVRVQDDYVVQWAGADEAKPLPPGIVTHPPAEYERPLAGLAPRWLPYPDSYAAHTGLAAGWPIASDGKTA